MSYAMFRREVARVNDLLCVSNLLTWDARVMMPPGGVEARGHQIAAVTSLARDCAVGEDMRRALDGARAELADAAADDLRRREVDTAEGAIAVLARLPAALVAEVAELKPRAQAAWVAARAANDFAAFAPVLSRTVALQRETAEAIGYEAHPYDALVGRYEPGMTWGRLETLYAELKGALPPLVDAARAAPPPRMDFLTRAFPVPEQKRFASALAARMGYDFERGRLDDTVHPFETSFTRSDVRITGRFSERWLPGGLFAVWHEAGHGMYEQGVDPAFTRSAFATDFVNLYAVGGASFGIHESQSRLWENRVGRSRRFWQLHFDALRDAFPGALDDVTADEFWRAVNAVRPSLIRVEADEATYDLHIILRCEIEAELVAGTIEVADLPALWAQKVRDYLGLDVPSDTLGVLQDVHWSSGMLGAFPAYTLGNIMASQLFEAAERVPEVAAGIEDGDYAPLRAWLLDNVHRHGRSSSPHETLLRATGRGLETAPYLSDLSRKVASLGAA